MSWPRPDAANLPRQTRASHPVCYYRGILLDLLLAASYVAATVALFVSFEVRTIYTL
jgi:hypothetical protein